MRIFEIVWLGVVIELISSNWKEIATCADWYITDIFFSCKCVINELTRTRHNCQSSCTYRYTHRQEVNKKKYINIKTCIYITVKNAGKQLLQAVTK